MYNNEVNDSPYEASLNFTLLPSWRPLRAEKETFAHCEHSHSNWDFEEHWKRLVVEMLLVCLKYIDIKWECYIIYTLIFEQMDADNTTNLYTNSKCLSIIHYAAVQQIKGLGLNLFSDKLYIVFYFDIMPIIYCLYGDWI